MDLPSSPTRQFSLTIIVRVRRERLNRLRDELDKVRCETIKLMDGEAVTASMPFAAMKTIHYARWVLIDHQRAFMTGPQLVLSTNYDGPVGDEHCSESTALPRHIDEMVEHGYVALHRIYGCCEGYNPDSEDPQTIKKRLRDYLKDTSHHYQTSTFYIGAPGRSRDQIFAEADLRRRVERVIDDKQKDPNWPPKDSLAIRRDILGALGETLPSFPPQPSVFEGTAWNLKLLGAVVLLLTAIAVITNGNYLLGQAWPELPWRLAKFLMTAMAGLVVFILYRYLQWIIPEPGRLIRSVLVGAVVVIGVIGSMLASWDLLATFDWQIHLIIAAAAFLAASPWKSWKVAFGAGVFVGLAALIVASPGFTRPTLAFWSYAFVVLVLAIALFAVGVGILYKYALKHLHHLEATDPPFEPYHTKAGFLYAERTSMDENRFYQNQLSNISVVKSGAFRALLLRGVFYALQLLASTVYNKGKLGQIPTIHFARWVLINDGSDALFLSNFDSSWQSYLGDFIDKASTGLTAVWSNTVGYPRTHNLLSAGSEDADRFKAWARHVQVPTHVWYSAYPGLSIRNINDNTIIRRGLAAPDQVPGPQWLDALHGRQS